MSIHLHRLVRCSFVCLFVCDCFVVVVVIGMLLSKKRTRSVRSLVGSPEAVTALKFDESDVSDIEVEQPTKRVALQVR